ncbi:hypothetical protein PG993_006491 [Apiospora rasikravindrae]|uniref:Uncharacterized protein n=1 Tax=Apiospora rasikravindrae TaxID=990691 RepID=A0ABR1T5U9_9PEZI
MTVAKMKVGVEVEDWMGRAMTLEASPDTNLLNFQSMSTVPSHLSLSLMPLWDYVQSEGAMMLKNNPQKE